MQDGVADLSSPTVFLATVRYQGSSPRHDVQVTLVVDGMTVAAQTIGLEPGQSREVRFPAYQLDVPAERGRATFVTAEVSIPHDRLPADDRRVLVVPVVSALPVVFVDQYGPDEDPGRNLLGATFRLRRLLTPVTSRTNPEKQLVEVRHVKAEDLDRALLQDARLVVIAGLTTPPDAAPLVREYLEQGGFLVVAAGADFDPAAWTLAAWNDGLGILPAPLKPTPVGRLPQSGSGRLEPFQLDFAGMIHEYFRLEQTTEEELDDLYSLPYFFKAVEADLSDEVLREAERRERERLQRAPAEADPRWLLWERPEDQAAGDPLSPEEQARRSRPRVLAQFTNGVPFMIERNVGRGQVLFVSTGVFRDWNTLTSTNAVVIFDRIFRDMLARTLPRRNLNSSEQLLLPVPPDYRQARFTLRGPEEQEDPISVEALGADRYGLAVGNLAHRGHYRITAYGTEETPQASPGAKLWEVTLAVNGPADESDLSVLSQDGLAERSGGALYDWVDRGETIRLAGSPIGGRGLWKWLMMGALVGLFLEMGILGAAKQ